jgi:hypothetical protein
MLLLLLTISIPGDVFDWEPPLEEEIESIWKELYPILYDTNDLIALNSAETDTARLYYKTLDSTALTISWDKDNIEYSYTYQDFMDMNKTERDNVVFVIALIQVISDFDLTLEDAKAWNQFLWDFLPKRMGEIDSLPEER